MVSLMQRRRAMMQAKEVNRVYLYNNGDECTSLTGGWTAGVGFVSNASRFTTDKTNNWLEIKTKAVSSGSSNAQSISTNNAIDLSQYNTMKIECAKYRAGSSGSCNGWIYLPTTIATANNQTSAYGSDYSSKRIGLQQDNAGTVHTVTVDISAYTLAYLSMNLNTWSSAASGCYLKIYAIWLE